MFEKVMSLFGVVRFCWLYSLKVGGKKVWLLLFYKTYISIHAVVSAFLVKLEIDTLLLVGQESSEVILMRLGLFLLIHFLLESWMNFCFRHNLVISRTLQRKLISGIEIDLAYKNAVLPISTIEDSKFRDKYALVKREAGFRLAPVVEQSVSLVAGIVAILATAFVVVGFSPWFLVIMLVTQIPRLLIIKPALNKVTNRAMVSAKLSRRWEIYLSYLEGIRGAYEGRILNVKEFVKKKLIKIQDNTVGLFERTETELLLPRVGTAIIPSFGIFGIGFLAARRVVNGLISIGDWQLVISTSHRMYEQLRDFIDNVGSLGEASMFVEKLGEVLSLEVVETEVKTERINQIEMIEFVDVSFRYPNAKKYSLKNVSLTIGARENIAIVGHNGAGKTTLVKLMCRFYEPTEGEIRVNGKNVAEYGLRAYQDLLSVLFQDFKTYYLSANESIGYGDIERIGEWKEIEKVAKRVGIHGLISSLPQGYETPLLRDFEGGVGLSTGQWQKLAIARALFRNSKVIILDEPTSNLDPESEEEIFNKLIKTVHKRIMVLISHRFSTVKKADRIVVIDKGKLIEQGTHKELVKKDGLYSRLYK
ncbi:ABC transporter ATP-binding protein, partial [Pseudomonadota bacterium]